MGKQAQLCHSAGSEGNRRLLRRYGCWKLFGSGDDRRKIPMILANASHVARHFRVAEKL
jgi:hypothetical protein